MFLQPVKVKRFAETEKKYGNPPWSKHEWRMNYRSLRTIENDKKDDVFYIIGVSSLKEGYTDGGGYDEPLYFVQKKSYKVFIVAKSIGKRYKVLPEDIEELEEKE